MTEKIKTLQTIHLAICAGTILAYYFLGNVTTPILQIPKIDSDSIPFVCIPIAAYVLSNFLFKSQLKQIDSNIKLEEKLPIYQTASLIRWAILEGAAFVIIALNPTFILFGIFIILYLISLRPTESRISSELA
ncbi:MAG: MFS transporter [Bacteroidota bacterium]